LEIVADVEQAMTRLWGSKGEERGGPIRGENKVVGEEEREGISEPPGGGKESKPTHGCDFSEETLTFGTSEGEGGG